MQPGADAGGGEAPGLTDEAPVVTHCGHSPYASGGGSSL
jgi:hypothetical protein